VDEARAVLALLGHPFATAQHSGGETVVATCVSDVEFHSEPPPALSLMEIDAALVQQGGAAKSGAAQAGSVRGAVSQTQSQPVSVPLGCECRDADCECEKTCYCRVRTTPYAGSRLQPPAGLPGLIGREPLHDCACGVVEVGGPGFDAGNGIDCDCRRASCVCARNCTCAG